MIPAGLDALPDALRVRRVRDDDRPLLERIYAGTRADELALTDWNDTQKAAFVAFQFNAQHRHYQQHFGDGDFLVIEQHDQPVGRLYLHWRPAELQIVDIALLPDARGRGIGTLLLERLIELARERDCVIGIHVVKQNPALRLYQRLGFRIVGEQGFHDRLERAPDAS